MLIVVSYDVDDDHAAIKQNCLDHGWVDCVVLKDGTRRRLPNTTLLVEAPSPGHAVRGFFALAREVSPNVTVEKIFATMTAPASFWLESDTHC